jgi:hypothetical protein
LDFPYKLPAFVISLACFSCSLILVSILITANFKKGKIMEVVEKQKTKLMAKKNKIAAEEIRLNIKERKMRTRHLIEVGGLVVKASLDNLPTNTLYGALLSLKQAVNEDEAIRQGWNHLGKTAFDLEAKTKTAIILKLTEKPPQEIRTHIRSHGLKWNHLRQEWYGYVTDIDSLKEGINNLDHQIEVI